MISKKTIGAYKLDLTNTIEVLIRRSWRMAADPNPAWERAERGAFLAPKARYMIA
jgi:hypothetical protein